MVRISRRRRRRKLFSLCALDLALVVTGCRFSGSAADPYAEAPLSEAKGGAGGTASTSGTDGTTDSGGTTDTGGTDTGATGGSSGNDGSAADVTGAGGATGGTTAPDAVAGTTLPPSSCQPATPPAICDPVKNIGCLVPFSFCDIDQMQAVASGRCVFPWTSNPPPLAPRDAGSSCYVDATTDTCVATSTCVHGSCRKLCYCDSDCGAGECCTELAPGSSSAFRLCKPC